MNVFDYIVVGAGSAGCVVARRLSDDPGVSVLLLEAGPSADGFWNRTPAGVAKMHRSERFNWNYFTEPVPALNDRKVYWPRGKALGGSGAINGMVYVRGDRRDFDAWARLGNPGWAWDDVLPYFKRSECNVRGDSAFHSAQGPMAVSEPSVVHPTVFDFLDAADRCGVRRREDFGDGELQGAGIVQYTIRNGVRESTYDAFIKPVRNRNNLTVASEVQVCRVLLRDRTATGVEVRQNGQLRRFDATREVILSAGAVASPHLLMLSGIGDGEHLAQHGVPVVLHLPGVGRNLQDHYTVRVQAETTTPSSSYNRELRGWRKYWQGARYLVDKGGYLALGTSTAAAFIRSHPSMEYADVELSFRPMTFTARPSGEFEIDRFSAISTSVYRVRPSSRGRVLLRSPDPLQPPAIQPNYLDTADDVEATVSGIRQVRRILATEPLRSRLRREIVPGPQAQSDDELADYVKRDGNSVFHPAGSCRMGNDALAVVDSELRVRGIDRLRVIDASIMPVVTSGNTNAPTIMIGEKGADLVRRKPAPPRDARAFSTAQQT